MHMATRRRKSRKPTGLGDHTRNVGYRTGSITWTYETHTVAYDRAIRLFADVMDVEEAGIIDCFAQAGAELQRTQVAPEGDAYTFSEIASTEGVVTVNYKCANWDCGGEFGPRSVLLAIVSLLVVG
jgi:hypothetical protein